jgi:undecaprenyl-diphosphatase
VKFRHAFELPPTRADMAASRVFRQHATPSVEKIGKALTLAADEKPLLAGAVLYWLYSRAAHPSPPRKARADHLLTCVAVSAALPHLVKLFVDRERPDRKLMQGRPRHGIPYSGNAKDSFPSGHATHLGAIAAALTRTGSAPMAVGAWLATIALSTTRLVLLAHYVSDVLGGLAIGAAIEPCIARITKPQTGPKLTRSP